MKVINEAKQINFSDETLNMIWPIETVDTVNSEHTFLFFAYFLASKCIF